MQTIKAKFPLGRIVATPGVLRKASAAWLTACLQQHASGNWGLVDAHDRAANDQALREGSRILSAYALPNDPDNLWILTEADRSVTTFLLPEEY